MPLSFIITLTPSRVCQRLHRRLRELCLGGFHQMLIQPSADRLSQQPRRQVRRSAVFRLALLTCVCILFLTRTNVMTPPPSSFQPWHILDCLQTPFPLCLNRNHNFLTRQNIKSYKLWFQNCSKQNKKVQ